jgi:beta-galactosidase
MSDHDQGLGDIQRRRVLQLFATAMASTALPSGVQGAVAGSVIASGGELSEAVIEPPERGALSLNAGWRFHLGDIVPPKLLDHAGSYSSAKAGGARGAAAISYDDSQWRELDLPHDWAIETPPDPAENMAQGYRKRGYGWYRRSIVLDADKRGRYFELQFGAIATNATIWFNGNVVAHNWSGYNSVLIDVTAMARFGAAANILVVRVDADALEGWWYEGAGIYRDVWLIERGPVSIVTDGVHANPRLVDGRWRLPVEVSLYSVEAAPVKVEVQTELLDREGRVVVAGVGAARIAAFEKPTVSIPLEIAAPRLWSVEDPYLYATRTRVLRDGVVIDERLTQCGFRSIAFDATRGFFLNGQHVKLKGMCIHQDHAGVGVAVPPALVEWRVKQLKAMGCNAIRCSHGAPDVALLDACDRLGMLVMDENRNFSVTPDYIEQLDWLIRRDRNRPCVILWSIFNEEPTQSTPIGFEMARRVVDAVKRLDDTRPVTAAMSAGQMAPVNVAQAVDVVGFNYQHREYDRYHRANPDKPMLSSEDTSAFITRGAWISDRKAMVASSDDTQRAGWGATHREAWKMIETRPFMAGGFGWTGFDYHGEPTPHRWPANSSYFGAMDLCGFPKSAFYLRRAMWVKDRPLLDILPHWTWPGQEGEPIKVMIATNVERVQLFLNGKSVGDAKADPFDMVTFEVPYAPGRLEARGWSNGRIVARDQVETTGPAVRLRLTPDRSRMYADGVDCQPITIEALDAKGRPAPSANDLVSLGVVSGRIIGLGNGDPTSLAPSKGGEVRLFNGRAQVIVQTRARDQGALRLSAQSSTLAPARPLTLVLVARSIPASPPASRRFTVQAWRRSPVFAERPGGDEEVAANDMNSWGLVTAGEAAEPSPSSGFVMVTAHVVLSPAMKASGVRLIFTGVAGRCDVLADKRLVASKAQPATGTVTVELPAGRDDVRIALIFTVSSGEVVGLPQPVFVEAN